MALTPDLKPGGTADTMPVSRLDLRPDVEAQEAEAAVVGSAAIEKKHEWTEEPAICGSSVLT